MHENVATHMFVVLLTELRRLESLGWNAIIQVTDDDAFAFRLDEDSNSLAVLVRHLSGHMRSRFTDFVRTDGEKPWRDRNREFDPDIRMTRDEVLAEWQSGWECLFAALRPLTWRDMERSVVIRGTPYTIFDALARQIAHYGTHVGQVVMLSKHLAGPSWVALTLPKGATEAGPFVCATFGSW